MRLPSLLIALMTFAGPVVPPPASAATPRAEGGAPRQPNEEPRPAATPRPIRLVANEVIARGLARLMARTADTAQRISVRGGLIGLGSYTPRGGADYGMKAPPRHLFPAAGVGGSLNVDPNTGRSYFTNTP